MHYIETCNLIHKHTNDSYYSGHYDEQRVGERYNEWYCIPLFFDSLTNEGKQTSIPVISYICLNIPARLEYSAEYSNVSEGTESYITTINGYQYTSSNFGGIGCYRKVHYDSCNI